MNTLFRYFKKHGLYLIVFLMYMGTAAGLTSFEVFTPHPEGGVKLTRAVLADEVTVTQGEHITVAFTTIASEPCAMAECTFVVAGNKVYLKPQQTISNTFIPSNLSDVLIDYTR